jgi:hypothetical protein
MALGIMAWLGTRDASRSITWSAVSFGYKKMFGMPRFCELGRDRRPITIIAGKFLITKAALKEMGACSRRTTPRRLDPSDPTSRHQTSFPISLRLPSRREIAPVPTSDPGRW